MGNVGFPNVLVSPKSRPQTKKFVAEPVGRLSAEMLGYQVPAGRECSASSRAAPKAKAKASQAKAKAKAKAQAQPKAKAQHKAKAKAKASAGYARLDWKFMWYKNYNNFGIRRVGGIQIFSFGLGSTVVCTGVKYKALLKIAKNAIIKLLEGTPEHEVGEWCKQEALVVRGQ